MFINIWVNIVQTELMMTNIKFLICVVGMQISYNLHEINGLAKHFLHIPALPSQLCGVH